jgi:hypothetical protein
MSEDLSTLDTQVLLDMLATHTANYTRLMTGGTVDEFETCKVKIALLQGEINSRQQTKDNTDITSTDIEFTSETT